MRITLWKTSLLFIILGATYAAQSGAETGMIAAVQLGQVLGAEEPCGMQYDAARVEAWIDANIAPDDIEFTAMLSGMTDGARMELEEKTGSQKAAVCRAARNTAVSYGFCTGECQ